MKKQKMFLTSFYSLLIIWCFLATPQPVNAQNDDMITFLNETKLKKDIRMDWWREARLGMFIHWGIYAVPAGIWKGEKIPGIGEWIMAEVNIPVKEYEKLTDHFNPVKFNAAEWVRIAKDAGMRYIVITSKHHDGFCLWDSDVTSYDIVDVTPYQKDILAQLTEECQRQGVKMCFYYSILNWHHPAQYVDPDAERPRRGYSRNKIHPEKKYEYIRFMKIQLKELILRYDPKVLWFDGEWVEWWKEKDGKELYNYLRSLKADLIINNRIGKGRQGAAGLSKGPDYAGDFGTPEQEIPDTGQPGVDWESCMTMNDTWGYKSLDDNWKSTETLVQNLVDIASKGGNYLLNVGPTAEGLIPEPSIDRLAEIGDWIDINGESIYATTASPFGKPDWGRYTKKQGVLYAHIFDWPTDGILNIPVVEQEIVKVNLLTQTGGQNLKFKQSKSGVSISLPSTASNLYDTVVKLELKELW